MYCISKWREIINTTVGKWVHTITDYALSFGGAKQNTMRIKYFSSFWRYGKWHLEKVSNFFPWQPWRNIIKSHLKYASKTQKVKGQIVSTWKTGTMNVTNFHDLLSEKSDLENRKIFQKVEKDFIWIKRIEFKGWR